MTRHLSPTTHVVDIGDDLVVLDASENAYFCLPAAAAAVQIRENGVTFADPEVAEEFEAAGFLADRRSPRGPMASAPARDLGLSVAERPNAIDVLVILAAWATMAFSYHAADFKGLAQTAGRGRGRRRGRALDDDAARLVASFERILPWLPFQGVCLYRSFLLLRVLRWRGHDARWVFGVRTWPFQAHCWLQVGDVALDDTADRLAGYAPIMVV